MRARRGRYRPVPDDLCAGHPGGAGKAAWWADLFLSRLAGRRIVLRGVDPAGGGTTFDDVEVNLH